ncbi:ribbon-helix-helix protein, CopG family [Rathayibacter rathayi]|uniref:Ribbon-helix-helix protein, CopG family n=1 Tax=Rathayibacter rathayi TaxID=33887 RepID=A0ABD6W6K1_RATRA|nr:ribbon-helix-helix protein, CopG family [Rathayibacter rathayi]SOE06097.1 Ribbon-helix-helix protein, copG family [Rathayibacter rathayi NCPPB 2980 = VKM Ac-1601]PPF42430.1 ribbon-helix-helix protein, CopG family [Rathayibacter rathayi]PPF74807.1 ribbon-helix-helix protein, CopG family [Rathayibacter rathayi]PPG09272.1 ribbon-helix-helix protein, CopG family [Rathayibacter rathayi]
MPRISTTLSLGEVVLLDELASKYGLTRAEVIRRAIQLLLSAPDDQGFMLSPTPEKENNHA